MKPPTLPLPYQPENLPPVDHAILEAVAVEHEKSTGVMGRTLRGFGWSPMQVAFVEDHWSWTWVARAVVGERIKRGLLPAPADVTAALIRDTPSERLKEAEAAQGPTPTPRPPAALGAPIQLPPRPLPDYLRDPVARETDEPSRGETL